MIISVLLFRKKYELKVLVASNGTYVVMYVAPWNGWRVEDLSEILFKNAAALLSSVEKTKQWRLLLS